MVEKKKKLTLTVSSKPQNIPSYSGSRQKTSVVIEKKTSRSRNDRRFYNRNDSLRKSSPTTQNTPKSKFNEGSKISSYTSYPQAIRTIGCN